MEVLRVEGLSKNFGGLQVLQDISFMAEAGEKVAIIGPNGAGKTTLFHAIGGQLSIAAGKIYLLGQDITPLAPHHRLHLGLARSFQLNNLFFNLTVIKNMLLALKGAQYPHFQMFDAISARPDLLNSAQKLLEPLGLWERRFVRVAALPYGDKRLLEVALALASKPKVLLLDEPSAGLTIAETTVFVDTIRKLLGETALIFCAHDIDLVFNLAERIMVLYYGQIIAQGKPQEIQANPRVREIYLGGE